MRASDGNSQKSITVTDQQDRWIQAQMKTGNYGMDSELIREALREKQLRMNEIDALRAKLIAAELSVEQHGWVKESPQEMLEGFKDTTRRDDKL